MSQNTSVTRSSPFEIVAQDDEFESSLSRTVQPSYHMAIKPSMDGAAIMDTRTAQSEKLKLTDQADRFVN